MSVRCKNNPNFFCFVCDLYTPTNQRQPLTGATKTGCHLSFRRILKNVNQSWKPQYRCPTCAIDLTSASRGYHPNLKLSTTMFWNEPQNHDMNCYFCNTTFIKGFNAKNKQQIVYADVPSVAKHIFTHVTKAENSLSVIENKRLYSKGNELGPKRSIKTRFYSIKLN